MSSSSPITLFLAGVGTLLVGGLVFRWLLLTSRSPTGPERIAALLLGLLVIEASLYQNPDLIPVGLFHPKAGPLSFRLFDVLIPLALAARFIARPPARRAPLQTLFWSMFLVWIAVEGIEGLMSGNSKNAVSYEAKAIIYIGMFVLIAAVPPQRWLESTALRRVIGMASVLSTFLVVTMAAHFAISVKLPLLPLEELGSLGTDAATTFAILGIVTLAVGACSERNRMRTIAAALPMLAAPLVSGQRAAMLSLAATVAVLVLAAPFSRRYIRVTWTEVGLLVAAIAGVATALVVIATLTSKTNVSLPLAREIQETFNSRGKQLSAEDRVNQWAQARALIANRPWFGWGLGKEYAYYSPGSFEFVTTELTHNIILDLLLRTGVVGLILFLLATAGTVRDSIVASVQELDPRLKALALGCTAAFVGLIVKGMFESIFEKYRIVLLMGILIGMSISFAAARLEEAVPERELRFAGADDIRGLVRE
ncbi:MAG TPA: O-antigen ligase family protein [Solirubrobacteraceae bacterium]|jgi:O-antigen ligase